MKGKFSISGFKHNSPDKDNDFNIIPSNRISMKGVKFPVKGVDDTGHEIMMMPGAEYVFPGNVVMETRVEKPSKQMGGAMTTDQWDAYNASQGYQPLPYTTTGAAPSKYKQYYNPKKYKDVDLSGQGLFNSVKDEDIFMYKAPIANNQKPVVAPTSNRKVEFTPNGKVITYPDGRVEYFDMAGNPQPPLVQQYKFGGSANDLKSFLVGYMNKKLGGAMKFQQGENMDSYLDNNMKCFKDYLAKNVMKHMITEEVEKGFMQYGGENEEDIPMVPLSPEEQAQKDWMEQQQNNMAIDNTPWYGPKPNAANSALNSNMPISFGNNGFNQFSKNYGHNMANAAIAGINGLAYLFEQDERKSAEEKVKQKYSTDNLFAPVDSTMDKGDYEANSGKFRPNMYSAPQYKEGGVVYMDEDEINEFLRMGGSLKYMDKC